MPPDDRGTVLMWDLERNVGGGTEPGKLHSIQRIRPAWRGPERETARIRDHQRIRQWSGRVRDDDRVDGGRHYGDIASCDSSGDEATARLLDGLGGTVVTLGDNAYDSGTATEFANCFDPTWGRSKGRMRPAVGNHEYITAGASGYFGYSGAVAGDAKKGYYSYDLGTWHVIALNSNCSQVGGCQAGSAQEQWLRADLAAHPNACTLAYWHHPRFSSGEHGNTTAVQPLWQALYDANADVMLAGHDHDYERFAPQSPTGAVDLARGLREFVVGTGGKSHYGIAAPIANSETHNDDTFGVLKLTLHPNSYDWTFIPEAGKSFTDAGSTTCH
jgi:acid phosphatase type 7